MMKTKNSHLPPRDFFSDFPPYRHIQSASTTRASPAAVRSPIGSFQKKKPHTATPIRESCKIREVKTTGALYTETKVFDQYGRLKSIDGVLENLYKLDSFWIYIYGEDAYSTMENYNGPQIGELSYGTIVEDGKDGVLAQTTDKLAGEVTKYGYANEKLTAAVTYDESDDTILKVDTFVYDIAGRLTKTRFDHNPLTGNSLL